MKHILPSVFLLLFSIAVAADQVAVPPNTAATSPASNSSFAVDLARQAGAIAGAAQACGQDISLLSARLDEAITTVAENYMDASNAVAAYQQSVKESQTKQSSEQVMPCNMVLKDYQSLPLLRDDYKEVVLSALKAQNTPKPNPASATPAAPAASANEQGRPRVAPTAP